MMEEPAMATKTQTKKDQFGFREGSACSIAAAMWLGPEGATMAEVKAKTNSGQYNALRRIKEAGHTVSKDEDGRIKVTVEQKPKKAA